MNKTPVPLLLAAALFAGCASLPRQVREIGLHETARAEIAPGVTYIRAHSENFYERTNDFSILRVDYRKTNARFALHTSAGTDRPFRRTSEVAERYKALAAINGTFFQWKTRYTDCVEKVRGRVLRKPGGKFTAIAFNEGDREIRLGLLTTNDFARFDNVLAAPSCLHEGKVGGKEPNHTSLAPRTLVGKTDKDVFYLLVADGRQPGYADGISPWEGGELLRRFGCTEAMNLDGGGSSTMVARKGLVADGVAEGFQMEVLNLPGDWDGETGKRNIERAVLDQLLLLDDLSEIPEP